LKIIYSRKVYLKFKIQNLNPDKKKIVIHKIHYGKKIRKHYEKNDMLDFNVIKFFGIKTRSGKVLRPLPVRWKFSSPG